MLDTPFSHLQGGPKKRTPEKQYGCPGTVRFFGPPGIYKLYFCRSLYTLQRGLPVIAGLLL